MGLTRKACVENYKCTQVCRDSVEQAACEAEDQCRLY
jgi:hypothetical protein